MATPALRLRAALFVLRLSTAAWPAAAQYRRAPTLDDLLDLVQGSAPRISPAGDQVLFVRSELKSWKENKRASTIWIAAPDGSNARQFLSSDKDRDPRWFPDGGQIAFLSTRDQQEERERDTLVQIWVIRAAGGEAWKLTDGPPRSGASITCTASGGRCSSRTSAAARRTAMRCCAAT